MASPTLSLQGGMPTLQGSGGPSFSLNQSGPSSSSLQVDPTSTFDQDTQSRYQYAVSKGIAPEQAMQAASQYQQQKSPAAAQAPAASQDPSYTGLKGLLLNKDSLLNLSTLGSIGGGILGGIGGTFAAPFTAGVINPIDGAIAGSGLGGAGGEALREHASGQNLNSKDIALQGALGAAADGGGQLVGAGLKAAAPAASKLLSDQAERLGLGSLGITKGQSAAFGTQTNAPLGQFLTDNGLIGKSAEDVSALKQATQDSYDAIARKSGIQVPVSDVTQSVDSQLAKLRGGVSSDSHDAAQAIDDEYQKALSNMGVDLKDPNATVDIGKLTDAKSEYQKQVNWKNPDNINEVKGGLSSALLDAVNNAAGNATDAQGNNLQAIGKKLQGLNLIDQWAQKAANTTGTSKGPWTIGNLARPALATIAGTAAGPVGMAAGAIGGVASDIVANSPAAIRATAGLYKGGSAALANVANSSAPAITSQLASAPAKMIAPAASNVTSGAVPASPTLLSSTNTPDPTAPQPVPEGMTQGQSLANQAIDAMQQGGHMTQDQYQALMSSDAFHGGRNQSTITAAYQASNPTAVQGLGVASNATNTLSSLYDAAGGAQGPITGSIENALSNTGLTSKSVKSYNDQATALGQEIISQIYGTAGTSGDRDQILNMIPKINDSSETAASKMATLRSLIQQRLSSMGGSTASSVNALSQGPSLAGARP